MNTVILAAGKGNRLKPLTNKIPKCLVKIQNKSLLAWQLDSLTSAGISNIHLITGYKKNKIINLNDNRIKKIYFNENYQSTNMVKSLLVASNLFFNNLLIVYSDIIYSKEIILKLIKSNYENAILVDLDWLKLWSKRFQNPLDDAESLRYDREFNLIEIGKKPNSISDIMAQYLGIIKFNAKTLNFIKQLDLDLQITDNLYMTELLTILIKNDINIKVVPIRRNWLEIDNINDLRIYEQEILKKNISIYEIFK